MNKKQTIDWTGRAGSIVITTLSVIVVVLALLLSTRLWFRADLSANKSWTISKVSKKLADEIPDQIHITYFVSDKLKQLTPFPAEIADLINEYVSFSGGKISFVERDPAKENLESLMEELGFPSQQIRTTEKDQASFINVFSGILIEYEDRNETLPFVYELNTLEYDITSRILSLIRKQEKTVGVIAGDSEKTLEGTRENVGYSYMYRFMTRAGYKLRAIGLDEIIDDTISELFIIGGAGTFDDWMLYQIDRFIQRGGKVFFATGSIDITSYYGYGMAAAKIEDKGLLALLKTYGVEVKNVFVLDESALLSPSPSDGSGGMQIFRLTPYPFYVHSLIDGSNSVHPITSRLAGLDFYWPNPLELSAVPNVEAVPLISTTPAAWLETENLTIDVSQSYLYMSEKETTKGTQIVAAALSGTFPSYWEGKTKPVREGSDAVLPDMPAKAENARIVVVGNANATFDFAMGNIDFLSNNFAAEQPNLSFMVQSADWLGNDDDIISIRNRAPVTGKLDRIIDTNERLAYYALSRIISIVLIPLLVLAAGILLAVRRKRKSQRHEEA